MRCTTTHTSQGERERQELVGVGGREGVTPRAGDSPQPRAGDSPHPGTGDSPHPRAGDSPHPGAGDSPQPGAGHSLPTNQPWGGSSTYARIITTLALTLRFSRQSSPVLINNNPSPYTPNSVSLKLVKTISSSRSDLMSSTRTHSTSFDPIWRPVQPKTDKRVLIQSPGISDFTLTFQIWTKFIHFLSNLNCIHVFMFGMYTCTAVYVSVHTCTAMLVYIRVLVYIGVHTCRAMYVGVHKYDHVWHLMSTY